jgi:hypothetical protein
MQKARLQIETGKSGNQGTELDWYTLLAYSFNCTPVA